MIDTSPSSPEQAWIHRGTVVALHLKPGRGTLVPAEALTAVAGKGFAGDASFGKRRRQASFISTVELDAHGYAPGTLRENVTVDFSGLQELPIGTRLRVGDVDFEIEQDCAPCDRMARRLGENPETFKRKTAQRRGMLLKVVGDGTIRPGDPVYVLGA